MAGHYASCIFLGVLFKILCVSGSFNLVSNTDSESSAGYNLIPREKLMLFNSFESVMEVFYDKRYRDLKETQSALSEFKTKCLARHYELALKGKTRKPFIVIEGNQRTSRKMIARRVARRLSATYLTNPPLCLVKLSNLFPFGSVLRRSYFGLCMYATARHVHWLYNRWPVVLNGYYYDQASFSIAQVYANTSLPPRNVDLYSWPQDLLKPDIIFYIDFPDNLHRNPGTTRHPSSWKPRMLEVYKTINDSSVIYVSTEQGLDYVEDFVIDTVVKKFSGDMEFSVYAKGEAPTIRPKQFRFSKLVLPK